MLTVQLADLTDLLKTRPAEPECFTKAFDLPMRERAIPKQHDLLLPGSEPEVVHLLLAGHACRYRMLRDGRRQITAILVPGDLCDLGAILAVRAGYAVGTLTRCVVGEISLARSSVRDNPDVAADLNQRLRRDEAIAREWIVSLGRRLGIERMAHLLCELRWRLAAVGLVAGESFEMRITQNDFADALGLTSVHVNRVLKHLRDQQLIHLKAGRLTLLDRPRLERLAQFDPAYLEDVAETV
jgi:CRP-like cAMP-binding protein